MVLSSNRLCFSAFESDRPLSCIAKMGMMPSRGVEGIVFIGKGGIEKSRIASRDAARCVARPVQVVGRSRRCGPLVVEAPCCGTASNRAGRATGCPFWKGGFLCTCKGHWPLGSPGMAVRRHILIFCCGNSRMHIVSACSPLSYPRSSNVRLGFLGAE